MAIKFTLHCPSTEKTKKDFMIRNPDKHFNLLYDIRSIFRTNYAAVYDIRAKPIDNLRDCVSGQVVQVAISRDETMKYYKPWNCIMYNGEDSANVDWMTDGVGLAWEDLNDQQRCAHITCVSSAGANTGGFVQTNIIRITRPYATVKKEVQEILVSDPEQMCTQPDVGMAIFYNWNWKWEVFLPASMMPDDPKDVSPKVLSLLTVLSSFTHGSARKVRAYVIEAVKARLAELGDGETKDPLLQEEDIVHVISTLYEKAGSPKAKDYLAEENKVKERERKETWSMSRRPEGTRKEKA
ncbi:hypothetical protein CC77DRAFT_1061441 [Alternaria alternata]|uniref:Uncharacterized protein n=4 Tax=Alternaria alternata complex TaxID=187734 RepID=A0A177DNE3_ALTAL|nr:hypothetical protein CC77DRAFT_1061441 [Alternaria alternata]XP_051584236.1 uncharacterized protein J4E82_009770 [Alternaria postmessia]RYN64349.1 hypothetical protein AA0118_g4157 [Alternaria tenuissima]KAH6863309.1 hypothetical protein B0T12DRAFT_343486 [Alternaria alternata]KAI5371533.1 hypothetical protein J4E82_009770 [Alternaria postmessia]OAG20878.1 hypothetical protein CC77DRAFT_1061441 [Alternaria alternata]RYN91677.1 hypothetical protein AA0120_g5326 [Alternaria tenuissima]